MVAQHGRGPSVLASLDGAELGICDDGAHSADDVSLDGVDLGSRDRHPHARVCGVDGQNPEREGLRCRAVLN
jgi:hypothetical protein